MVYVTSRERLSKDSREWKQRLRNKYKKLSDIGEALRCVKHCKPLAKVIAESLYSAVFKSNGFKT